MRIEGRRKILILLFAAVFLMSSVFPAAYCRRIRTDLTASKQHRFTLMKTDG